MFLEILADFAPYICTILASLLTFFASRHDAKKEISKLKLEWEHQSIVQDDEEFSEMCRKVYALLNSAFHIDADTIASVAVVRSKATGAYAEALDVLLSAVTSTQTVRVLPAIQNVVSERSKLLNKEK